ncbi:MAG: S41 family peptidase, partial [Planctomycetota bacterium]
RLYGSNPVPGGPAYTAGIHHGHEIIQINEESTINMTDEEAVSRVRGTKGTPVTLTIRREGEMQPRVFSIIRDRIQIKSVEGTMLPSQIAYLKISTFAENTFEEFAKKLESFGSADKIKGLMIDLRHNEGGLLDQAVLIADYFVKEGTLTSLYDGKEIYQRYLAEWTRQEPEYPICVLVNENSASGSEVLAGALQKNNRALLLGSRTFGKGSMQRPYPLGTLAENEKKNKDIFDYSIAFVKITVGEYLIPQDISIQGVGLIPDVLTQSVSLKPERPDLVADEPMITEKEFRTRLISKFNVKENTNFKIAYLLQDFTPEELQERRESFYVGKFNFSKEEEVLLAEQLLLGAETPFERMTFLQNCAPLIRQLTHAHENLILEKMKEIGVDWSEGQSPENSKLETSFSWELLPKVEKEIEYQELVLSLSLKNLGEQPLYRIKALTSSEFLQLKEGEFLFGKIAPGETLTRILKLPFSKFTEGSQQNLRIDVSDEVCSYKILEQMISFPEVSLPVFAFQTELRVADQPITELKMGQTVVIKAQIKNIGKTISAKGVASFNHDCGASIFLEKGRVELDPLAPGATQEITFQFQVKELPSSQKKFKITLYDLLSEAYLFRSFPVPVKENPPWNNSRIWKNPEIQYQFSSLETPHLSSRSSIEILGNVSGESLKSVSIFHRFRTDLQNPFYETRKLSFLWAKNLPELKFKKEVSLEAGTNTIIVIATEEDGTQAIQEYSLLKN